MGSSGLVGLVLVALVGFGAYVAVNPSVVNGLLGRLSLVAGQYRLVGYIKDPHVSVSSDGKYVTASFTYVVYDEQAAADVKKYFGRIEQEVGIYKDWVASPWCIKGAVLIDPTRTAKYSIRIYIAPLLTKGKNKLIWVVQPMIWTNKYGNEYEYYPVISLWDEPKDIQYIDQHVVKRYVEFTVNYEGEPTGGLTTTEPVLPTTTVSTPYYVEPTTTGPALSETSTQPASTTTATQSVTEVSPTPTSTTAANSGSSSTSGSALSGISEVLHSLISRLVEFFRSIFG